MSSKHSENEIDTKSMCELIFTSINVQSTAKENEFGQDLMKILWHYDILKKPIEKILEPLLDGPDDLEMVFTGSVKEGRRDLGADADLPSRLESEISSIGLTKSPSDVDIMLIMNKSNPIEVKETDNPGFYYINSKQSSGKKKIDPVTFKNKFLTLMMKNIDSDYVEIKKPERDNDSPAISLRIKTGQPKTKYLLIDLIPALKTDMTLEEEQMIPDLKTALTESQFFTLKSLPIYIVPKSSSASAFDWRVSYSLHEEMLFRCLTKISFMKMAKYYGDHQKVFNTKLIPSYLFKIMHLHYLILSKASLKKKDELSLKELLVYKSVLREKLPHPCNKNIKIMEKWIHKLWYSYKTFRDKEDDKEEYISVKEYSSVTQTLTIDISAANEFNEMKILNEYRFHRAAMKGNTKLVEKIKPSKINEKFNEMTPLFVACLFGQIDVAKTLISKRADVNLPFTRKGITCLHITCLAACKETDNYSTGSIEFYNEYMYEFVDILKGSCMYGDKFDFVNYTIESFGKRIVNDDDCLNRYQTIIKLLLENGANPNAVTRDGVSALILCCKNCNLESAKLLVECGADVNQTTWTGMTSLSIACLHGDYHIAELLLQKKAHVNGGKKDKNRKRNFNFFGPDHLLATVSVILNTEFNMLRNHLNNLSQKLNFPVHVNNPLVAACFKGIFELVNLLIQNGADVRAKPLKVLMAPLQISCMFGHVQISDYLISELQKSKHLKTEDLNDALVVACSEGHLDIAEKLLKNGANFECDALEAAIDKNHSVIVQLLIQEGDNIHEERHKKVWAPLIRACANGFNETAEILLQNGADVDEHDWMNESAINKAVLWKHYETVELLLRHGANIDNLHCDLSSPLQIAIRMNAVDVQQLCLTNGANTEYKDKNGLTALGVAVSQKNFTDAVKLLINHGADVNSRHIEYQDTPLHITCESYHEGTRETLELLLENGADVNAQDFNGHTPLHIACSTCLSSDPINILIKYGANVNIQDNKGFTPLGTACSGQNLTTKHEEESLLRKTAKNFNNTLNELVRSDIITLLIENNADVNILMNAGSSPLHMSCSLGCSTIVQNLMEHGAKLNVQSEEGHTPLHVACSKENQEIAEILLTSGAEVDIQNQEGFTPLVIACSKKNFEIVELLINYGADVNIKDTIGDSPLLAAFLVSHKSELTKKFGKPAKSSQDKNQAEEIEKLMKHIENNTSNDPVATEQEKCNTKIIELLIKNGANVNINLFEITGYTLLRLAFDIKSYKVAEILIRYGANFTYDMLLETCRNGDRQLTELLIKKGANVNTTEEGRTPLHIVCFNGNFEIAKLLIKKGANVNNECSGVTPLFLACNQGSFEISKLLIENGAKTDVEISLDDVHSPLLAACKNQHRQIAKLLIKHGADVDFLLRGIDGTLSITALHCSARTDNIICCEILIELGANVNAVDKSSGYTPLHIACRRGFVEMVQLLVKHKVNVNAKSLRGFTPLHHVVQISENKHIAELLMKNGADTTIVNIDSLNVLQLACYMEKTSIAEVLLKNGADVNAKNETGSTVLHQVVAKSEKTSLIEILLRHGADASIENISKLSALEIACFTGKIAFAKIMIKHGAVYTGHELLFNTILCGQIKCANLLIRYGANFKDAFPPLCLHWYHHGN